MQVQAGYECAQKRKNVKGETITIHNLTPCYPEEERKAAEREIERRLYDIFVRYGRG